MRREMRDGRHWRPTKVRTGARWESDSVSEKVGCETLKPTRQNAEVARRQEQPHRHQHTARDLGHHRHETPVLLEPTGKTIHGDGGDEEGHGETDGVGEQQAEANAQVCLRTRVEENSAQNRTDTRGPSRPECDADQHTAQVPDGLVLEMNPALPGQDTPIERAKHVQPEHDDESSTDTFEPYLMEIQEPTDPGPHTAPDRRGAEIFDLNR